LATPFDVTRDVATHVVGWSCPGPPSMISCIAVNQGYAS
jgi:hypothetical protein